MKYVLLLTALCFAFPSYAAKKHTSTTEKRHFAAAHPCPGTGKPVPSCPGYVLDHVVPLCAGGEDKATNMQWQEVGPASYKDKIEWAYCRCLKKHGTASCPQVTWKP